MLTRRRFLGFSAAGMLAVAAGCRPAAFYTSSNQEELSSNIDPLLADKVTGRQGKAFGTQKLFLGLSGKYEHTAR